MEAVGGAERRWGKGDGVQRRKSLYMGGSTRTVDAHTESVCARRVGRMVVLASIGGAVVSPGAIERLCLSKMCQGALKAVFNIQHHLAVNTTPLSSPTQHIERPTEYPPV